MESKVFLSTGSDDVKIEMAFMVGSMTLTNSSKEQIARQSAKILIQMLSKPEGRAASLQALYNLSGLDDNATILVDSAVLPALTDVLFKNQDSSPELKELAASTMANIVSNPGSWELAPADKEGHPVQSESFIYSLLRILPLASPQCQISILHIIYGIASSPQASGLFHLVYALNNTFISYGIIPSYIYLVISISAFNLCSLLCKFVLFYFPKFICLKKESGKNFVDAVKRNPIIVTGLYVVSQRRPNPTYYWKIGFP